MKAARLSFRLAAALLLCAGLLACAEAPTPSGQMPSDNPGDTMPAGGSLAPDESGQTGSLGPVQCGDAASCQARVQELVDQLQSPAPGPGAVTAKRCTYVFAADQGLQGTRCECDLSDGRTASLGPQGLGCYMTGRGGTCLLGDEDFTGCDEGETASCEESCQLLQERLEQDAAHPFDVEVLLAECTDEGACASVLRVDDQCFTRDSLRDGVGYDCALGAEGVFAAWGEDLRALQNPGEVIEERSSYRDTDAFIELTAHQFFAGTYGEPGFSAMAQFFPFENPIDVITGEVLDPLEGLDDCRIARSEGGPGLGRRYTNVESLTLLDDGQEIPLQVLNQDAAIGFYNYWADLTEAGLTARYGGRYGVRGSGGGFGTDFEFDDIILPEALSSSLETSIRIDPNDFTLTWQGRGEAPLQVRFWFAPNAGNTSLDGEIYCELVDDGEHRFEPELFDRAPGSFAFIDLMREDTRAHVVGQRTIDTRAQVTTHHLLAFGDACDGSEVMQACERAAVRIIDTHQTCWGDHYVPAREQLCPDYLLEACHVCPERFACQADHTQCIDGEVVQDYSECECD